MFARLRLARIWFVRIRLAGTQLLLPVGGLRLWMLGGLWLSPCAFRSQLVRRRTLLSALRLVLWIAVRRRVWELRRLWPRLWTLLFAALWRPLRHAVRRQLRRTVRLRSLRGRVLRWSCLWQSILWQSMRRAAVWYGLWSVVRSVLRPILWPVVWTSRLRRGLRQLRGMLSRSARPRWRRLLPHFRDQSRPPARCDQPTRLSAGGAAWRSNSRRRPDHHSQTATAPRRQGHALRAPAAGNLEHGRCD